MTTLKKVARITLLWTGHLLGWIAVGCAELADACEAWAERLSR